ANVNEILKDGGRSSASAGRFHVRRALVAAEFALALTLLAGGGLAVHSLMNLTRVDLGFQTKNLLVFQLPIPDDRFAQPDQVSAFHDQLIDRMNEVPGIRSLSASTGMPVRGTNFGMPFFVAGKPVGDPSKRPGAGFNMVSARYFETFGIPIVRGRAFTEADRAGTQPVMIVNETFVTRYLAGVDPLQQRIVVEQLIPGVTKLGPGIEWQIVGIARNVKNAGPRENGFPEMDVPLAQSPWPGVTIAVRAAADPLALQRSLADKIRAVDPDLPMVGAQTMQQIVDDSISGDRFKTVLFSSFAVLALVLAGLGIYGVMSFLVVQRTHAIGLRMALGAERGRVESQVLKEGMLSALIGVGAGLIGAYLVGRAMRGMWFGVGAFDPVAFMGVALVLLVSALLACVLPARRAASVDPLIALRQE
ncbi:MAG TPA: FtsX-like permease family protein, partial [Vicinamibacterales bacterium]|nr:FtsX-like permease family protein [Vicinamibacterales bacterium]